MPSKDLTRLRKLALALPEATEKESWGTPTFRVRDRLFAMYASSETHVGRGRPGVWLKAARGNQQIMVEMLPHRFFVPPYVGPSGWVGVYLDEPCDWDELPELIRDAWKLAAPKRVVAASEAAGARAPAARGSSPRKPAARKPAARKAAAREPTARKPAVRKPDTKPPAGKQRAKRRLPARAPRSR